MVIINFLLGLDDMCLSFLPIPTADSNDKCKAVQIKLQLERLGPVEEDK